MKLFYTPGACSMSPHIVLNELGLPHSVEKVDLRAKKTEHGDDFLAINPKGQIPTLLLDDGTILTEGVAIVQYLADQCPNNALTPPAGSRAHYHLLESLNYVATELHKTWGSLFNPAMPAEWREVVLTRIQGQLAYLDQQFSKQEYVTGATFSIADAYMFTVLGWATPLKIDFAPYPHVQAYLARIGARPAVQQTLKAEGLI
ncbi:MAG: glutathione transferase GstA [Plesiomonas sp.]|uniref:glutathione transferase GstA n=1 Tax=Plesiomonas sp. TaxID=2486279 RepID=UPI003F3D2349